MKAKFWIYEKFTTLLYLPWIGKASTYLIEGNWLGFFLTILIPYFVIFGIVRAVKKSFYKATHPYR